MPTPANIDTYIASFPKDTQKLLQQIRQIIHKAAPEAEETINYAMPTFKLHGNLVHFAGYNHHIGFYPAPSGIVNFKKELAAYETSKGAIQFPLDKPLPVSIITQIVKFRVVENTEKAKQKTLRTCPKGHKYYKSTDCPTCPVCEAAKKPAEGFLSVLSAPARRALENIGVKTVKQLAKHKEADILSLHGMGPSSIPKLKQALKDEGLSFKK